MSKLKNFWKETAGFRIVVIIATGFILILPVIIINYAYWQGYQYKLAPNTMFSASDLLIFYASFLTFIGTAVLGLSSIVQNQRLHEQNLRLENQRFVAENAPILIPSDEKISVFWKLSAHNRVGSSVANEVVLVDEKVTNKNTMLSMLYGEIKLQTNEVFVSEYKISNLKVNFHTPDLEKSLVVFKTDDNFKIAQPIGSNSFKMIVSLFLSNDDDPTDKQKDTLLRGNFSFQIQMDLSVKSNNIIADYFCLLNVKPQNKSRLRSNFLGNKHVLQVIAIMRTKPPYLDLTQP